MDRALTLFLLVVVLAAMMFVAPAKGWNYGTAAFYGGPDGSGTMGGACGYGNLFQAGYGTNTTALSSALFNDGAACGQCYLIMCDNNASSWCKVGVAVTVTATNLCPANWSLPGGGLCGPPRAHLDMSQPAWERIGVVYDKASIIPVVYQQVTCWREGGIRITIGGFTYFPLVRFSNVGGSGSIGLVSVKGTRTGWIALSRSWGANWQCNSPLVGQALSFIVTNTGGQTIVFQDAVPARWMFGQTFTTQRNFDV